MVDDTKVDEKPRNGQTSKISNGGKPKLQKERIMRSLVYPEDNGIQETNLTENAQQPNCNFCRECNGSCCKTGVCQQSRRKKNDQSKQGTAVEAEPCCSAKKKKSLLRRKSTNLFLSGICMLAVTGISIADIATDVLTAREYYSSKRVTAFLLSLVFLIVPPILLTAGIIRRRDDSVRNTSPTKTMSCCGKFLIFVLNVPLKLYMIWLQLVFTYRCFKRFHKWRKSRCLSREENLMGGTLSHFITELTLYKLWNSIFESMPQLLLTIHVIMTESDLIGSSRGYLLILSSSFSFVSLCVGIIYYAIKAKEAESKSKNKSNQQQQKQLRAKSTVLGIPQIILMSVYTVCFLGSRTISLSYFILFFEWYAIIVPGVHWIALFLFFTYRRYVNQKNTMQHYRVQTYNRRSSSFVYVFVHSVMSVFIHIKPECEEVLDQPRFYKIIFYFFYSAENCFMILLPLMLNALAKSFPQMMDSGVLVSDGDLQKYQYYIALYTVLGAVGLACCSCALYHFMVHKAASYTREQVFGPCCRCCFGPGGFLCWSCSCCCCCRDRDEAKIYVTCKNIQTHEIHKTSLKDIKIWKQSTESELLNKKHLRRWKVRHNEYRDSSKKPAEADEAEQSSETSSKSECQTNDGPYTMRRSGLNILSDPQGHLFYAPINELKTKTIPITY